MAAPFQTGVVVDVVVFDVVVDVVVVVLDVIFWQNCFVRCYD